VICSLSFPATSSLLTEVDYQVWTLESNLADLIIFFLTGLP